MEIHWNAAFRSTPPLLFPGGCLLKLDRVLARAQRLGPSNWPQPLLGQYPKLPMVKSWNSSRDFSKAWLDANNVPGLRRAKKLENHNMGWKGKFKIFKVGSASYITARAGSKLKKSRLDLASLHIFFYFCPLLFPMVPSISRATSSFICKNLGWMRWKTRMSRVLGPIQRNSSSRTCIFWILQPLVKYLQVWYCQQANKDE